MGDLFIVTFRATEFGDRSYLYRYAVAADNAVAAVQLVDRMLLMGDHPGMHKLARSTSRALAAAPKEARRFEGPLSLGKCGFKLVGGKNNV